MGEIKKIKQTNKFGQAYETFCSQKCTRPLSAIQANLADNRLRFCCDRVSLEDWSPILNSIAADRSLVEIHVFSRYRPKKIHETIGTQEKLEEYRRIKASTTRAPIIYTNYLLRCFVDAVAVCARDSTILTSLILDGIPLADGKYLDILCAGLVVNQNLQNLSLARCKIGDEGCGILFGTILEDTWLQVVNLTACSLTSKSADFLSAFLKKKRIKLLEYIWNQTGISGCEESEAKHGLQTLVLDQNRKFGDEGLRLLAGALKDDFWLKTLSMRRCGLTRSSNDFIMDLLETNSIIILMNFKNNKIPADFLETIRRLLKRRQDKGERIPLKRRLLNRKKDLKWKTRRTSRKKRTKNRRKIQRSCSKEENLKSGPTDNNLSNKPNLMQLNERLSKVIDCNRNLTQGLKNGRQLLVSEKLSRLTAERSYQLLRPAVKKLLKGVQKQDGIRGKILVENNVCGNLRKIFKRLECISAENSKALCELSAQRDAKEQEAIVNNSARLCVDEKPKIFKGAQKRPHCPPRQKNSIHEITVINGRKSK